MAKSANNKERSFFSKLCAILTDILVYPVLIIAFVCAIFMSSAKANNQVPSILGNSVVQVLTNSMDLGTEQSYKVGDVLIINQNINLNEVDVGDCIAFYAPKQSGYVDDQGNSLVIFHRVVRIVYVKDANGINKRYFVCHGDNSGPLTFVPAENVDESNYNEDGNLQAGGGYVVKLFDDDKLATNQDHELPESQSLLQYVADEFVVGELKSRASGILTGLVSFCCSSAGITVMVIVPSLVMIAMVVMNMVREAKGAKKEKEGDIALAQNIAGSGDFDGDVSVQAPIEQPRPMPQREETPVQPAPKTATVQQPTAPAGPQTTIARPAGPARPSPVAPKPSAPVRPAGPARPANSTAPTKPVAPGKPVAPTKIPPKKMD